MLRRAKSRAKVGDISPAQRDRLLKNINNRANEILNANLKNMYSIQLGTIEIQRIQQLIKEHTQIQKEIQKEINNLTQNLKEKKRNRALQAHQYYCYIDFVRFVISCTAPWDRMSL